jgi:hypothetical protein
MPYFSFLSSSFTDMPPHIVKNSDNFLVLARMFRKMMEYGLKPLFVTEFQFLEETGEYPLNEKGNCN